MTSNHINDFCDKFDCITKRPEKFISASEKLISNVKELIKETYDFTKKEETTPIIDSLKELVIENFDTEQIWQQLELQNESILTDYLSSVSRLVAIKDRLWFLNIDENESESDHEDHAQNKLDEEIEANSEPNSETSESEHDDTHSNDENLSNGDIQEYKSSKNKQISAVDDQFFKLEEMEQFLKKQEQPNKEQSDDSDDGSSVDLFDNKHMNEEENSESEINPRYDDFFGETKQTEKKKINKQVLEESESENEDKQIETKKRKVTFDDKLENDSFEQKNLKSALEIREERLKRKIEDIEGLALEEKPWQLKGEVTADKRPQNSLLEEIVDFDLTVRPAPMITEETTMRLEDVIKQRIKDKVWDDVERKTKLVETPFEYKKKILLDQEKSKQSLAQIYEAEYLKQQESLDPNSIDKPEEEPKEHLDIKNLMKNLFSKLDALSNFHFTPKTVTPELRIISNLPAINMEEVAPVAASDAALLAPEEIKNKSKGDEIGKSERSDTDKKRERRQKKQKQREHAKAKKQKEKLIEKMKPGLGNKYSKQKAAKLLEHVTKEKNVDKMDEAAGNKSVKSSTAFFNQLQDEVKSHIKSKTNVQNKNSKKIFSAKKLKL